MWSSAWKIFKIIILSNVISIAPNNNLTEPVQMSRTQFWLTFPPKCLQLLAPFRLSPLLSPSLSTQMNTSLYFGPEYNNQSHAVTPPVISTPAPRQLVASEINCDSRFTGEITNKKKLLYAQKLSVTLTNWIFDSGKQSWRTHHYRVMA